MMDRPTCIGLLQAARSTGHLRFAGTCASAWLAAWPGDLEVVFLLAQINVEAGDNPAAARHLLRALRADPDFVEAYDLLASALRAAGDQDRATVYAACAQALRGDPVSVRLSPPWTGSLARALSALETGEGSAALAPALEALSGDPDVPLPHWVAVRAHLAVGDRAAAAALAQAGYERWPDCVPFALLVGEHLLAQGAHARGVELLHGAVAHDPTGRIARRVLGPNHPYQDLWPVRLTAHLHRPVPAPVSALLEEQPSPSGPTPRTPRPVRSGSRGRQQTSDAPRDADVIAPSAATQSQPSPRVTASQAPPRPEPWEAFRGPNPGDDEVLPETAASQTLDAVKREFDRLAQEVNARQLEQSTDSRQPAYIVLSSRSRLLQMFGQELFSRIDSAAVRLVETIRRRPGWTAYPLYVDDPASVGAFNLTPADPGNAWEVKLRLADLSRALARRGETIGALLIVGGHEIVPFHLLPNPTDDDDDHVPSDNPYATADENYFVLEWPVGRFPCDDDPDLLVRLLRTAAEDHTFLQRPTTPWSRILAWLVSTYRRLTRRQSRALGYSASIWRKASLAVFRSIGEPRALMTSPPVQADSLPLLGGPPAPLSYYNLHGLEDAPEWFGQRDPLRDPDSSLEFPVALRPQDVVNGGRAPIVVFTEACFGANTMGRSKETALCLRFLDTGSRAVVGSTKVSYGAVTPPLIAADLLGQLFWDELNQSVPAGEALRRAKIRLAAEMHERQGYLDGEDQKTLISFVLYGDPLFVPPPFAVRLAAKATSRHQPKAADVTTACALGGPVLGHETLDAETLRRVKSIVAQYLPGMTGAECRVHPQRCGCTDPNHLCPSRQLGQKSLPHGGRDTMVVTFSKHVPDGTRTHSHYARLTLDDRGKVLKLAVSR